MFAFTPVIPALQSISAPLERKLMHGFSRRVAPTDDHDDDGFSDLQNDNETFRVNSKRRLYLAKQQEVKLETFLKAHGFEDVSDSKITGCLWKDSIYPIHVAAKLGEPLISAGVNAVLYT